MLRHLVALAMSFGLAGTTLSYAQPEVVATSSAVSGPVLVNHGVGYARLGSGPLAVGDRIMARRGGSATIVYSDGCTVHVSPGMVYTVDASACQATAQVPTPLGEPTLNPALIGPAIGSAIAIGAIVVLATQHNRTSASPFFVTPPVSH